MTIKYSITIIICSIIFLFVGCTSNYENSASTSMPSCDELYENEKDIARKAQNKAVKEYDDKWFWERWGSSCPTPTFKHEINIKQCENTYVQPMKLLSCKKGFTIEGIGERVVWNEKGCYYTCEEYCNRVSGDCKKPRSINKSPENKIGTITESTTCRVTQAGTLSCSTVTYD